MGVLRLLLAYAVFAEHAPPPYPWMHLWGGTTAVQIFYVTSGFYMQLILAKRYAGRTFAFYTNRALRIYPTYWTVVLLTFVFWRGAFDARIGWMNEFDWPLQIATKLSNALIFGQDTVMFFATEHGRAYFTANFLQEPHPLHVILLVPQAWTLGAELCFYLLAPWLSRQRSIMLVLLAASSTAARLFAYSAGYGGDPWMYRFFPFEIGMFLLGMLSCRFALRLTAYTNPRAMTLAALACFAIVVGGAQYSFTSIRPTFVTAAFVAGALPFLFLGMSRFKWDTIAGDFCYPLYLLHLMVFSVLSLHGLSGDVLFYASLGTSLAAALVMLVCVEWPIERIRRIIAEPQQATDRFALTSRS